MATIEVLAHQRRLLPTIRAMHPDTHPQNDLEAGSTPMIDAWGTSRLSDLNPGRFLVHADLHNHTLLSDGAGDPVDAFASLRDSGLDVAAITDHTRMPGRPVLPGRSGRLSGPGSLDEKGWRLLEELAQDHTVAGKFIALRGFEWSHPTLGHLSLWLSSDFTRPERDGAGMGGIWSWLAEEPAARHALAGFNHPGGRSTTRFGDFDYDARLAERVVSLEMFNKKDDYLFQGVDRGKPSPLVQCLAAGWRPALTGASDEHGDDWGFPEGKGRSGLWVTDLSLSATEEALRSRMAFATREKGLRLMVTAGGAPMGAEIEVTSQGTVEVDVDLDPGPFLCDGRCLAIQVLAGSRRSGSLLPEVLADELSVPQPKASKRLEVALDPDRHAWLVVRVSDPSRSSDRRAPSTFPARGHSIAYSSPIWLAHRP